MTIGKLFARLLMICEEEHAPEVMERLVREQMDILRWKLSDPKIMASLVSLDSEDEPDSMK